MNKPYDSVEEMICLAEEQNVLLYEIIMENEMHWTKKTRDLIECDIRQCFLEMRNSANMALEMSMEADGLLIGGLAHKHWQYAGNPKGDFSLLGSFLNKVMARALSCSEVNAAMKKIVACPTAGACGIVPAALIAVGEKRGYTDEQLIEALFVATGFGAVVMKKATVSGAEAGCQAECGVAAAMAAAAIIYLEEPWKPRMAAEAFSISLINCMGLICDPVAGMVQLPCAYRNASQAINAILSAELALSGVGCRFGADEVIGAMYEVGKKLPSELKETARGGLATTVTGKRLSEEVGGVLALKSRFVFNETPSQ